MKKLSAIALMLGLIFSVAAIAGDKEVTVEGKVLCAKCALKEEGRSKCQNVLVVEEEGKDAMHYYLTASEANQEFGEVCMSTPAVRATGTVMEKDGHTWLAATKIEPLKSEG